MLRQAPDHPKTRALQSLLGCSKATAVGHLELLFHFAGTYAADGAIGRWDDAAIAAACDHPDPAAFVAALIRAGWVDEDDEHRLIVHDWAEHSDRNVKRRLARRGRQMATNGRQTGAKRDRNGAKRAGPPVPEPEPEPEPEPDDDVGPLRVEVGELLKRLVEDFGLDGQRELLAASRTRDGRRITNPAAIPTAAWARVVVDRLTARVLELSEARDGPEQVPRPADDLAPASAWVAERGGPAACARSLLAMTAGSARREDLDRALRKAKAPPFVFSLIGTHIHAQTQAAIARADSLKPKVDPPIPHPHSAKLPGRP